MTPGSIGATTVSMISVPSGPVGECESIANVVSWTDDWPSLAPVFASTLRSDRSFNSGGGVWIASLPDVVIAPSLKAEARTEFLAWFTSEGGLSCELRPLFSSIPPSANRS